MKAIKSRNNVRKAKKDEEIGTESNLKPRIPSSPPTTIDVRGIAVHFPFKPYECQERYMEKVIDALNRKENALLESPTGTGKTLCLLCSTLAWQRNQARALQQIAGDTQLTQPCLAASDTMQQSQQNQSRVPVIIYASRTHSQLSQVVRELKNTRYRPKHAVLGSREQMCVNPKVKTTNSTVQDINHGCNKLSKERKCRYRNKLEGFRPPSTDSSSTGTQPVMDMEDLVTMGKNHKVCPFYYTRSHVAEAELILVPYNYLFDKDAREGTLSDVPWDNSIIIFDESHNLESFASDSASFDLSSVDIAGCVSEIQRVINYQQAMPEIQERVSLGNLAKLKAIFLFMEEYMLKEIGERSVYNGEFMMEVFKQGAKINHENHGLFIREVQKISDIIMDVRNSNNKGQTKLDFFITCVKRVFGETTEARCLAKSKSYRVHVTPKPQGSGSGGGRTISYWCFAPSLAMQELSNLDIRSVIVTSGTLSPLPSYSMELGLPFPHTLENPHIIKDDQIHVRVVGRGVSGKNLCSTYQRREDPEYLKELGDTLVSLAKIVPMGMLVFFPSYSSMETSIEKWGGPSRRQKGNPNGSNNSFFAARRKSRGSSDRFSFPHAPDYYGTAKGTSSSPWKRLLSSKAIVLEPKSTADLPEAIADFQRYLNQEKSSGCILIGVCRGKISEGIDFSHDMCRAVVVTGLPFAPYMDPKVKLKREYLDGLRAAQRLKASTEGGFGGNKEEKVSEPKTLSGSEWYTQQAHRAVNQAIGRVIRNRFDYGAVLLLDSRFGEERNQSGLSKWVRTRIQGDEGFGPTVGKLVRFYKDAKATMLQRDAQLRLNAQPYAPVRQGIRLEYERGDDEDRVENSDVLGTRVAVVRDSLGGLSGSNNGTTTFVHKDQVVAKMDIGAFQESKTSTDSSRMARASEPNAQGSKDAGLKNLYDSKLAAKPTRPPAPTAGGEQSSAWENVGKTPDTPSSTSSQPKTNAKLLLDIAKTRLLPADFAVFRKNLVKMKKFGDQNDSKNYQQCAGQVIDILIHYDHLEWIKEDGGPNMVTLWLKLMPEAQRLDMEKIALRKQLKTSKLMTECEKLLSRADLELLAPKVFSAFKLVFCSQPPVKAGRANGMFLKKSESILKFLLNKEQLSAEAGKLTLTELYCLLAPSQNRRPLRALLREIKDNKSIERQKLKEARKQAPAASGMARLPFLPVVKKQKVSSQEGSEEPNEQAAEMQSALLQSEILSRERKARVESQLRELDAQKVSERPLPSIGTAKARNSAFRLKQAVAPLARKPDGQPGNSKADSVSRLLRAAEDSPFVGNGKSKDDSKHIPSNSKSVMCSICDTLSNTPFLSDCGHVACSACWVQWLRKSNTCPVCRHPTTKSELSRMVFEEKASGDGPPVT